MNEDWFPGDNAVEIESGSTPVNVRRNGQNFRTNVALTGRLFTDCEAGLNYKVPAGIATVILQTIAIFNTTIRSFREIAASAEIKMGITHDKFYAHGWLTAYDEEARWRAMEKLARLAEYGSVLYRLGISPGTLTMQVMCFLEEKP